VAETNRASLVTGSRFLQAFHSCGRSPGGRGAAHGAGQNGETTQDRVAGCPKRIKNAGKKPSPIVTKRIDQRPLNSLLIDLFLSIRGVPA
jgi:hypothetical protein